MMIYVIAVVFFLSVLLFIGREVVKEIRNPHKGQENGDTFFSDVPKVKTRKMYSVIER